MNTIVSFSQNFALLLALTFVYGLIYARLERLSQRLQQVFSGVLFGSFAIISMIMTVQVAPGVIFDGRAIVLCIAGMFGGVIPGAIAVLMAAVYRLLLGGAAAPTGVAAIITSTLIGIVVRYYYQTRGEKPGTFGLIVAGLMLVVSSAFWTMVVRALDAALAQQIIPFSAVLYPLGVLLLGTLLTMQQRTRAIEKTQQEQERRFHAIFDSAYQFVGLLKPDGTVLEANQTFLDFGGMKLNDVIGVPFWDTAWWTITPETQAQLKDAVRRAAQGEFVRYEVDVWGAAHHVATIDFSLKPIRDEAGQVALLIPEGRDISERKQLEKQTLDLTLERERSHLLKKFISDVSHDLRTPLAVIRLNLDLLQRTNDPQKQQKRIEALVGQEQHLSRLLTDMMAMLSLDDGEQAYTLAPVDLNELAQDEVDALQTKARRKKQTLTLNRAAAPLLVQVDAEEMPKALSRLVINALNYTPEGGTITLNVRQDDDAALLEIRDTGIGISSDDLPQIFQRFYRADAARSLDSGGSGLGLPIARRIVEIHKGRIEVESSPGAGSTFRVVLPLSTADQIAAGALRALADGDATAPTPAT
jgi:PAS domain S-box-containing protein